MAKKETLTTRAKKIKKKIDESPISIFVIILVFFISSFFTISQGVDWIFKKYNSTINWRSLEYKKIQDVRAGMNIEVFNDAFGTPTYTRTSENGVIENVYKGHDYWIQVLFNDKGTSLAYAITSCDNSFSPKIYPNPIRRDIVLQESTFSDVGNDPNESRYYLRYATANSYHYDLYSWGNPSGYQSVYVGINDACPSKNFQEIDQPENRRYPNIVNIEDEDIKKFRREAIINTYAETAPIVGEDVFDEFQIGVDRIEIRNTYKY